MNLLAYLMKEAIHGNAMYWQSIGNLLAIQGSLWPSMAMSVLASVLARTCGRRGRRSEHLHAAGERAGECAGAYPMDAELSRYLYPHWSRNGMKHLCCWKPPCVCDWHPIW